MPAPLPVQQLRKTIDPELFAFETTAELAPSEAPLGQDRALRALEFGVAMEGRGYNIFVLAAPGAGKEALATAVIGRAAAARPVPGDWVYVYNFAEPESPLALPFAAGEGERFRGDLAALMQHLAADIPRAFGAEAYETEKTSILKAAHEEKSRSFRELETVANGHGFLVQRSAEGLALVYTRDGAPVSQEDFEKLSPSEQEATRGARRLLHDKLRDTVQAVRRIEQEARRSLKDLEMRIALAAVGQDLDQLIERYAGYPKAVAYLRALQQDVLEHLDDFRSGADEPAGMPPRPGDARYQRYRANLLVHNERLAAAPVVFESNPTYHNLLGRIEHHVHFGALVTDFTLIKAGALHRANGGYLVLDARDLLANPFAYDALKRVLKDGVIRMEEAGEPYRLVSTTSLRPEPVPADVKVVLLGTPWVYYLLQAYDEEFPKLFKVKSELAEDVTLGEESRDGYVALVARQCRAEGLLPFHREAVAAVLEHGLRAAEHQGRLATECLEITDLLREAHLWAKLDAAPAVQAGHVRRAVREKVLRSNYLEEVIGRMIEEGTILIDTEGTAVGQANGLSVFELGDYAFGKPSRVTAKVFLGKEGVINIEREADLGGRIHNKGVLILQGYFGSRYAQRFPISFAATLCFEQSYGGVEGDSASSAELFALISALADIPLRQDIAVTGSVNQQGQIQAVGGINLKIEGFFQTCKVRGLTGEQGVLIPAANVKNLMLDPEVVEAARKGLFQIYAVSTVDEGMEVLTGIPAGVSDPYGEYPQGTLNARVMRRVERLSNQWKKLHAEE